MERLNIWSNTNTEISAPASNISWKMVNEEELKITFYSYNVLWGPFSNMVSEIRGPREHPSHNIFFIGTPSYKCRENELRLFFVHFLATYWQVFNIKKVIKKSYAIYHSSIHDQYFICSMVYVMYRLCVQCSKVHRRQFECDLPITYVSNIDPILIEKIIDPKTSTNNVHIPGGWRKNLNFTHEDIKYGTLYLFSDQPFFYYWLMHV